MRSVEQVWAYLLLPKSGPVHQGLTWWIGGACCVVSLPIGGMMTSSCRSLIRPFSLLGLWMQLIGTVKPSGIWLWQWLLQKFGCGKSFVRS